MKLKKTKHHILRMKVKPDNFTISKWWFLLLHEAYSQILTCRRQNLIPSSGSTSDRYLKRDQMKCPQEQL